MRILLIEDDRALCTALLPALQAAGYTVDTCHDGADGKALLCGGAYDVCVLDRMLPGLDGYALLESLRPQGVPVIFITAYDSYALKAFENKGIDYLLKPFGLDDLRRAIDKLGLLSGGGIASAEHGAPMQTPPVYQERFLVHMGARMRSVTTAEIAYFMADGKYLHLMTHDGKDYIVDRTLTEVGEKLPPNLFFRINRRFIVSFDAIREMIRYSGSRIKVLLNPPLAEGEEAFVSTDRVPDFREWLNR